MTHRCIGWLLGLSMCLAPALTTAEWSESRWVGKDYGRSADFDKADAQLVLEFDDAVSTNSTTIDLKRELAARYPAVDLNRLTLAGVRLVAKSLYGDSEALLRVGNGLIAGKTIAGSPGNWDSDFRDSFDHLELANLTVDSSGSWQLLLDGPIKVREIIVLVEDSYYGFPGRKGGHGRGGRLESVQITCESEKRRPQFCPLPFVPEEVHVLKQLSDARCIPGVSYFGDGHGIEVRNGCRARFLVYGRKRGR